MADPTTKSETYRMQGGINTKVSLYVTGEGEFLALQNVDFRSIGALSSFAGSTPAMSASATSPITGIVSSYAPNYSTYVASASYTVFGTDAYNVSVVTGGTFQAKMAYVVPGAASPFSFAVGNGVFGCNGNDFWTSPGGSFLGSVWQYSLPKPVRFGATLTRVGAGGAGLSGFIVMYYSLVRQDGLYGPALAVTYTCTGESAISFNIPYGPNLGVGNSLSAGLTAIPGLSLGSFGLSGVQAWVQLNANAPVAFTSLFGVTSSAWSAGATVGFNFTASAGIVFNKNSASIPAPYDYQGSLLYGGPNTTQGSDGLTWTYPPAFNPRYCEFFANCLFMAGLGPRVQTPNEALLGIQTNPNQFVARVLYSNPGTPEQIDYENFFDVGTDGLPVTGLRRFFTQLVVWKQSSTWVLGGADIDNFVLTEVSPVYGCISHRANCVWNQTLWFLDSKGIFEYNGSNVQCVSAKVEDYFKRMNADAASTEAVMIHVKERNEIWTAIPIDGATKNNLIVVYDYEALGWTTRTCPPGSLTALAALTLGRNKTVPYYGTASGMIGTFGASLVGDAGQGITAAIKTRFIAPFGNSVECQFRKLYVDATVPQGVTFPIAVNFYADKGASPYLSTTMALGSFQNRLEFGIPAKSLAIEFIYSGATFFQLEGFTLETRFQRNV
jgi:hypothetical protein